MSKKKKIIFILIVFIIILVPIITLAIKGNIFIPILTQEDIEAGNKKETERLLAEKANLSKSSENYNLNIPSSDFSDEELETFEKERQLVRNKEEQIKNVMNKYYPEDFNIVLKNIEKGSSNEGMVNITNSPIPKYEFALYDIVLKALEEKNLNDSEKEILKDFIKQQKGIIDSDENLKIRANSVLD